MVQVVVEGQPPFELHTHHLHEGWLVEALASNDPLELSGPLREQMGPYTIVLSKDGQCLQLFTGLDPLFPPKCINRVGTGGLVDCPPEIAHLCYRTTRYG